MAGRKITGPILGVVDLDFEVTLKVRNKKTGAENQYYYPNVGAIQTDHIRTADTEGMRSLAVTGMPQALLLIMGFNASLQTGHTLLRLEIVEPCRVAKVLIVLRVRVPLTTILRKVSYGTQRQ